MIRQQLTPNSKMKIILSLFLVLIVCWCEDMHFGRTQVCVQMGNTTCNKWNITVDLAYYYYSTNYMCFPGNTRVMTREGPKTIRQVSVGDQLLAYDFHLDRKVYSKITAWLHRDTDSDVYFTNIRTKGSNVYRASSGHNIAYNNNGTIGFKYADELQAGDELISVGGKYIVENTSETVLDNGLFSPLTEASNFYIFPLQSVEANDLRNAMILVHCLAEIDNPKRQQHWIYNAMRLSDWLGLNSHKNEEHENFYHPVTHLMRLFGSNHRKVIYHIASGDDQHLQAIDYGGSSSSWGSSSSSYSSGGYWGGNNYYYGSSNRRQQKQNRKMQLVAVFACLMQVNSVITSV